MLFPLTLWPAPSSSITLQGILLILETLFVPQGHSFMGVFQSLVQMESFLLLHVFYHYTGIPQQLTIPSSCPAGS